MTPARLDSIIASIRANGSSAPVSPHDLVTAFLLLADIRDAERALRKAQEASTVAVWSGIDETRIDVAKRNLSALGVDP